MTIAMFVAMTTLGLGFFSYGVRRGPRAAVRAAHPWPGDFLSTNAHHPPPSDDATDSNRAGPPTSDAALPAALVWTVTILGLAGPLLVERVDDAEFPAQ